MPWFTCYVFCSLGFYFVTPFFYLPKIWSQYFRDIQLLIFWGRLPSEVIYIFVWSPDIKFKIWGRSDQKLLRYSTFNILRSSSIEGHLHFKHFAFWFGPLALSFKFDNDLISGCFVIQILIFWGCLPLEVIFISCIFDFG